MITVVTPGTFTTIQDIGRKGFQRLGVPESGAMDKFSFKAGNLLVGNDPLLGSRVGHPKELSWYLKQVS